MEPHPALVEISAALRQSEPYRRLREGAARAAGLPIAAAAWIAELLREDLRRPQLVILPRESDALAWLEAAELFGGSAVYFAAPSLSPYQAAEASLAVRAEESVALGRILAGSGAAAGPGGGAPVTALTTVRALFRRLPEPGTFRRMVRDLVVGSEAPTEELAAHLSAHGYQRSDLVTAIGEYAQRGGVFDLWPPAEPAPVRLDFFGDTVESIRRFEPDDQRSQEPLDGIVILPLTLFPADPQEAMLLADLLEEELSGEAGLEVAERLDDLRQRGGFPGWQNYLPALAAHTVGLADWLPQARRICVDPAALVAEAERHAELLAEEYRVRREQRRLALPLKVMEMPLAAVRSVAAAADLSIGEVLAGGPGSTGDGAVDFRGVATDLFHGQLPRFPRELDTARARRERMLVLAAAEHHGRLEELCRAHDMALGRGGVELVTGELARGFRLPAAGAVLYGEGQLFPRPTLRPRRGRAARLAPFVTGLRDLKAGDYVVHDDHGIGQFLGLRTMRAEVPAVEPGVPPSLVPAGAAAAAEPGDGGVEVMQIAYRDGGLLLLPLASFDQVKRYSGIEGIAPQLDRLGGASWNRTKDRVRNSLRQLAGDLLRLYAERQLARAPAMEPVGDLAAQFAAAFDYEETADQLEAIAAIGEDLERERPMDRLLCGDVGFGKTEVAMRAAFKVVESGWQVALLAPTTILVDQHLETFRRRFAGFPVRIEMVSRFRSPQQIRAIRDDLAAGKVDILIGTHRLLSRDVDIPRLALLIVDEEQRFGVAQKERLKQLKKSVHCLAMSATPVPRTLQLSLAGVRDLSVIETPPRDRMAVETAIVPFGAEVVREAIEFELERGGQVFYVYNRVETVERMSRFLRELVPGLRLTVGHGQLPEHELEKRMHAFTQGEHDLLLATTIIENGIDLPNVNTMLVHRADRFGLAQLYQLRGRVGRSDRLAYCYLLVPADRVLSEVGRQRLAAIREFTELGAGFRIAARDLEIRGAGNLLGAEQSGHIAAVGIETYLKMLEDAVRELKGEGIEAGPSVALDLPAPLAIPTEYIADANLRMEVYRKIASADTTSADLLAELVDRFGPPPDAVRGLLAVADLKRLAEALRVQSIAARGRNLSIRLRQDARVDVDRLIGLVSAEPAASFSPAGVLTVSDVPAGQMVARAMGVLAAIGIGQET